MGNESESRTSGAAGGRSQETKNPRTQPKQPMGGASSRAQQKSSRVGSEGHVSQQSNADTDGPSRQTSTAQDEEGQV